MTSFVNELRNLKPLSLFVFFFALACERTFIQKCIASKVAVLQDREIAVGRRVRISFSPDILQAGAVKGLKPSFI